MMQPEGQYIVWIRKGDAYWPKFYPTAEMALLSLKDSEDWYLTEAIEISSVYTRSWEPPKQEKE